MSSSRDSSVWRSLAVAFGDGLAFGVGMKLTQSPPARGASQVAGSGGDRIALLEERIRKIERAPAALTAPAATAPQAIDQQVLDALVNAVETRLQEQAATTERHMADLEARLALELKTIHENVRALAANTDQRVRETQTALQQEVGTARQEVAELATGRRNDAAAIAAGLEKLGTRIVAIERNASSGADASRRTLMEGYESLRAQVDDFDRKGAVIEARFTEALTSQAGRFHDVLDAVQSRIQEDIKELDRRLGDIAAALSAQEHTKLGSEIGELRRQADAIESETAVRAAELSHLRERMAGIDEVVGRTVDTAVLAGMESAERRLLEQVRESSEQVAAMIARNAETALKQKVAPLAAAIAELQAKSDASEAKALAVMQTIGQAYLDAARRSGPRAEAPHTGPEAPPQPAAAPAPASGLPDPKPANGATEMQPGSMFGDVKRSGRVWRVPLVSSFVLGAGGLALLRLIQ